MTVAALYLAGFIGALALTGAYRRYALHRKVLDLPNARSSHEVPTPRGGGVAIVVSFLLLSWVGGRSLGLSTELFMALSVGGGGIAVLGLVDDHRHVPARWRLVGHFTAAAWGLGWLGSGCIPTLFAPTSWTLALGYAVACVGVVWLLNLYNFMDGVDGIASAEAISVCCAAGGLWYLSAPTGSWWTAPLLAACTLGFFVWNFPPARIFMGDVGSGFLGFSVAMLAMGAAHSSTRLLWAWAILLAVFVVDATVTLFRRAARRERVYEAHRSHAYQHASRRYGHLTVTLATLVINVAWLFPIAAAVAMGHLGAAAGMAIAYSPLVCIAVKFRAGQP